jgi:hypothetical protein
VGQVKTMCWMHIGAAQLFGGGVDQRKPVVTMTTCLQSMDVVLFFVSRTRSECACSHLRRGNETRDAHFLGCPRASAAAARFRLRTRTHLDVVL